MIAVVQGLEHLEWPVDSSKIAGVVHVEALTSEDRMAFDYPDEYHFSSLKLWLKLGSHSLKVNFERNLKLRKATGKAQTSSKSYVWSSYIIKKEKSVKRNRVSVNACIEI